MALLTNSAVEEKLLRRVRAKASTYGQDIEDPTAAAGGAQPLPAKVLKVDPERIVSLYRDHVIPLTKEVEVIYLLERLSGCHVAYADARGRRAAAAHFAARMPPPAPPAAVSYAPHLNVDAVLSAVATGKALYGIVPLSDSTGALDVPTVHRLSIGALRVCADVLLHDEPLVLAAKEPSMLAACLRAVHGPLAALQESSDWLQQAAPGAQLVALPPHADLRALLDQADAQVRVAAGRIAPAAGSAPRWRDLLVPWLPDSDWLGTCLAPATCQPWL